MTHNLLMCNKKGCTINNYPLKIQCDEQILNKINFDPELLTRTIKKMDLSALTQATKDVFSYLFRCNYTNLILKNSPLMIFQIPIFKILFIMLYLK